MMGCYIRGVSVKMRLVIKLLPFFLVVSFSISAFAHTRSQSFSSWYIHDRQVRMSFSVQGLEVTRLGLLEDGAPDLNQLLTQHLTSNVTVRASLEPCQTISGPQTRAAREGYLRVEWQFVCSGNGAVEVENNAFFAVASSHIHYARIHGSQQHPVEVLFTNIKRRHELMTKQQTDGSSRGASFVTYLWLGIEHIIVGVDHLAFLLALLLLCGHGREIAYLITGFTVGHSLTLSLATLGVVNPNVPVIESLIGFTIALVAAENIGITTGANKKIAAVMSETLLVFALLQIVLHLGVPLVTLVGLAMFTSCYLLLIDTQVRMQRWRPILTALFGLIHGFGFASVLLDIGLPTDHLIVALLGFNVGVEIGQLAIVATLWVIGRRLVSRFSLLDDRLIRDVTAAVLCGLGLFWFVGRALSS
jgi:hypothetical protein